MNEFALAYLDLALRVFRERAPMCYNLVPRYMSVGLYDLATEDDSLLAQGAGEGFPSKVLTPALFSPGFLEQRGQRPDSAARRTSGLSLKRSAIPMFWA